MALDLLKDTGTPLDRQKFTWKDMVHVPHSKLDADAFTRVRIILMNGIEQEALRFQHSFARMSKELRGDLARVRRTEQHQTTTVNWLLPSDLTPIETTIAYEQVAIEVTASVAQNEPNPYLAQVYRFGLLEDFDHLYRYSALMDRLYGRDPNTILQSYTDIMCGRPTAVEHRHPDDDVRDPYDRAKAELATKLYALTIMAGEQQTQNYYLNIGPTFPDPVARRLYAEIASIEEQHVTQYESIIDPGESWLEKWLLHEATEAYNYYCCVQTESDSRIKQVWERFLDYELGHVRHVAGLFQRFEKRDPAEILSGKLPEPIAYESQREFVRSTLLNEVDLRAVGSRFVPKEQDSPLSIEYRDRLNSEGSPSETVAAGYRWRPGTEIASPAVQPEHEKGVA